FRSKFTPIKILGQGGFGCIFEAENKLDKWRYAVKRIPLRGKKHDVNKAMEEVCALASFDHPSIVRYNDSWKEEPPEGWQVLYHSMISDIINMFEKISNEEGCSFLYIQMEPSNILFASVDRVKICDLGIVAYRAIKNGQDIAMSRTVGRGTPMYMAPEQGGWAGYSAKVDIFSLGLILAQLCVVMTDDEAEMVFDNYRRRRPSDVLNQLPEVVSFRYYN
ncbi:hypothetical protein PMAYCL1PPCAC_08837, partial [Pristionchus mayeri]